MKTANPKPKPQHLNIVAPEWLTESQADAWNYAVEKAPELLNFIDRSALTIWVIAEDTHRQAAEKLAQHGLLVKAPGTGVPMQSPYLAIVNAQAQIMLKAAGEMGFTPARRDVAAQPSDYKLTQTEELFCLEYVKTGNASEAYREANPKSRKWKPDGLWVRASQIMARDGVSRRIAELQAIGANDALVTVDSLNKKLETYQKEARADKQFAVCVAAVMGQAKLFGFLVDKKEIRTGALDMIGAKDLKAIDDAISEFSVRSKARESQPEGAPSTTH